MNAVKANSLFLCVQRQTALYNNQITGYQYEEQLLFWELQIARTHQSSAWFDRLNGSCTVSLLCETSVCSCIAGKGTTITAILLYRNPLTSQRSEESCKADFLYLILINGSSHHISYLILLHARGDMYNHLVFHHTFGTAAAPWKLIYGCERHLLRAFSVYAMVTLPPSSAAITVDSHNHETAAELEKPSVVWGTFNFTFIHIVGKTVGKHCNDYNNATQNDNTNNSSHKWVNKKFPIKVRGL